MQPLFYFPSTILCIDDSRDSLIAVQSLLSSVYKIHVFQNPHDVLEFLKDYPFPLSKKSFLRAITDTEEAELLEHCPVDFDISSILQLAQCVDKEKEITLLFVDYGMPEMDGLELCRALKDVPSKKLLFTGMHSHSLALNAFNKKIIDNFIQKESSDLADEILAAVQELTVLYFYEKTQSLLNHLEVKRPLPLSDSVFIDYFSSWRKEKNIQEYYLIDKIGSFFCLDDKKNAYYFIVHTEHSLENFIELKEGEAGLIVPDLFHALHQRQKIPFFGLGRVPEDEEMNNWESFFYAATVIDGREKYYKCVIESF